MTWLVLGIAGFWILVAAIELRAVLALRPLPERRPDAPTAAVTIVVPVRDDAHHVERTVHHLLAQRDVDLHLVVVDDRSKDGTGALLQRLAAGEPRLLVKAVRDLPPGWLGKTHALHVGCRDVATPWLLFVDGDSRLTPSLLARAIDAATAQGAQHVALLPGIEPATLPGRACLLAFQSLAADQLRRVNATPQRSFVGAGAFNLVRTDAYRAIGGHERLRLEVVDDVWLGRLLFRGGFRSRIFLAPLDLVVDWGGTPRRLLRDTEKNTFAVFRYRTWLALPLGATAIALVLGSLAAPWWSGPSGWIALAAFLGTAVPTTVLARKNGWSPVAGALAPLGRLVLPLALLRSTWATLRRGGVSWRGTFYPLDVLRRGQLR